MTAIPALLLQSAVQAYGAPTWGVSMLSLTSVDPNVRLATGPKCKKPLGSLCLDGTSLTIAAAEVIIAFGSVVVIMLLAIPCVVLEWRRKSGRVRPQALNPPASGTCECWQNGRIVPLDFGLSFVRTFR